MSRVKEVEVGRQDPEAYRDFHEEEYGRLIQAAQGLVGKNVVHINSTTLGGGVAELLASQVPLERGLGLDSHWLVIQPQDQKFFEVTKHIHNLLQGEEGELTGEEEKVYEKESVRLRQLLEESLAALAPDIIVCHDPQPLAAVVEAKARAKKILRVHPDICAPNPWIMAWLCERMSQFQRIVVSRMDCTTACLPAAPTSVVAPAIDPLAVKNQPLPLKEAREILKKHGVDTARPIAVQISRFDPWKDPVGVIEAYCLAKERVPELQLVLVGFVEAKDDPEAERFITQTREAAGEDADIFLFVDLAQLRGTTNAEFVRAVQTASDVILQKSTKEGFGLTVTEAMWKGKAVVGGNVGGIRLQIEDRKSGWLVNTPGEAGEALITLLQDTALRERLGAAARVRVREKFLLPRFVRENLEVYTGVI